MTPHATRAGVAGRLGLQIVGLGVHNHRVTDDRIRPFQRDHRVHPLVMRLARRVCFQVAKIARVPHLGIGPAVLHVVRIEVTARRRAIGRAAIPKFMDVKPVRTGRQTRHVRHDLHPAIDFRERHHPRHIIALGRR